MVRKILFTAMAVFLGLLATYLIGEIIVRIAKPLPKVQVINDSELETLSTMGGEPVWEDTTDRQHLDCARQHPDATRIMIFGSSILYGVGLPADRVFSSLLEAELNRSGHRYCVLNFSQPGFTFQAKWALARELVPRYRPALIFWEDWLNGPSRYVLRGDTAYNFHGLEVGEDGLPSAFGLPTGLNAWLFDHSRLFEYATLALAPEVLDPALWSDFYRDRIPEVTALARSVDADLVHVLCPQLDKPFAESAANIWEPFEDLIDYLQRDGVDYFRLEVELSAQDHLALRSDPCCHYSEAGHAALAPVFLRWVRAKLEADDPQEPGASNNPSETAGSDDLGADRTR